VRGDFDIAITRSCPVKRAKFTLVITFDRHSKGTAFRANRTRKDLYIYKR
jgi:hypothetical protein